MKCFKFLLYLIFLQTLVCSAQSQNGYLVVGGDGDKFYPVVFADYGWDASIETQIELGRSDVHFDGAWRGSLISSFKLHTTRWGNGARHVNAEVWQQYNRYSIYNTAFIAGYLDATGNNGTYNFVIWLKGGNTTYFFKSNVNQNPDVYDGVQHALPFQEVAGAVYSFKSSVDPYINSWGLSSSGSIYLEGEGTNYMNGGLALGTRNLNGAKLAVNGNIRAKEIKVETANWPDYVFDDGYEITPLAQLDAYIKAHKHLPDLPSAQEAEANGIALGEMNKLLVKKIEELTLLLIEKDKKDQRQQDQIDQLWKESAKNRPKK